MSNQNDCQPMSVHLETRSVAKGMAFYVDVLGFEVQSSWPSEGDPLWCSLNLEGQTIMLGGNMEGYEGPDKKFQDENHAAFMKAAGGGLVIYVRVDDIDAYYQDVVERGAKPACEPKNEFYGLRNFMLQDLDGYRIAFYTPIQMESCGSCGMPLADAVEGQMYCQHCADDTGQLRPYEAILEGTISGYFMGMMKMERSAAEVAAQEHLSKMPAWSCMNTK